MSILTQSFFKSLLNGKNTVIIINDNSPSKRKKKTLKDSFKESLNKRRSPITRRVSSVVPSPKPG